MSNSKLSGRAQRVASAKAAKVTEVEEPKPIESPALDLTADEWQIPSSEEESIN